MGRLARTLAAAAAAAIAGAPPARAQLANADALAAGRPAGLALPAGGAASAEEPHSLGVNPAGVGFVREACLQWFHEADVAGGSAADGLYLANGFGPLAGGLSLEWVRPEGPRPRYRKTTLALALTDAEAWSLGIGGSWLASPDAAWSRVGGFDLGLTLRPWRHLSLGAAALGLQSWLDGERLPARYDLGVATRLLDDGLTLSADLLADDRARGDFSATHAAFGLGLETRFGLALGLQLQLPVRAGEGRSTLLTLAWSGAHAGYTGGVVQRPGSTGWLAGVRASTERYRTLPLGRLVPSIDVARELAGDGGLLAAFQDRQPWLDLLGKLDRVRDDPEVAGLVVRIGPLDVGRARAEELRDRLAGIAGRKPVLAWLAGGGTREYLVATGASAIAVPPGAAVFFNGVGTEPLYLAATLARAGVSFDVVRVGAWKSAPENLSRSEGSSEGREAIEAILEDVHGRDVAQVSLARRLPADRVVQLFDRALFSAGEAKEAGLVDELLWPDELEGWARRRIGRGIALRAGYEVDEERGAQRWGEPPTLGLVLLEGTIVPGKSRREPLGARLAGADTVTAALRRAAEDPGIAAVVLRIDSGGGDGGASDLIWREVVRTRARKPVVVSMGDLAASGGYLAAVGADAIVAEPSTLTGSIGVFAMKPDVSGLLDKLGVRREPHQRGEKALVTSIEKPWTPAERAAVQAQIDGFYARFVDRVAEGRRLDRADVERVAQGRAWTGRQALERRLVDRLGSLADAVDLAREKARIAKGDGIRVRRIGATDGLALLTGAARSALSQGVDGAGLASLLGDRIPELRAIALLGELGPVIALPLLQ